jgi:opacity protein-like surface antigen
MKLINTSDMNLISKIICLVIFGTSIFSASQAQQIHENVNSSGGNASGSEGTVSYSIGQAFYATKTGSNGSVAEGVQQAFEISEINTFSEQWLNELSVSVYPNPANEFLILKIGFSPSIVYGKFSYYLFDLNGKLLENKMISGFETELDMRKYKSGIYFIRVTNSNTDRHINLLKTSYPDEVQNSLSKTFKIIKN